MRWMMAVSVMLWIGVFQGTLAVADPDDGKLTVTGVGRVDSVPDMATITVGVTSEARTAAEALNDTSAATTRILARMAEAGIAPRDVQTRDLGLSPLWDNRNSSSGSRPKIVGYQASNTVIVRVRALAQLGPILDDVVENGANNFHGLAFGLQNPEPVQDDARRAAVADAMRKAQLYAGAGGLTLGAVLELSEAGSATPQPVMMERSAMMSDGVPVAQGEVSTNALVTMVFAIDR